MQVSFIHLTFSLMDCAFVRLRNNQITKNTMAIRCALFFFFLFVLRIHPSNQRTLTEFPPLNLYIGTDGDGFGAGSLPMAAQSPYGGLRLGPDTSNNRRYSDSIQPLRWLSLCG